MKFHFTAAVLAAASLFATPASAEVVKRDADGFITRDAAVVDASPQEVWIELITPGNWWNDAHTWSADASNMTITPQGGGCFCERIPATEEDGAIGLEGSVQHMTVIQAFPRKVLRMRGGLGPLQSEPATGILTVTIKQVDGGTRILWEYVVGGYMRYDIDTISKAVDGVMTQQLDGLAAKLGRIDKPTAKDAAEEEAAPTDEAAEPDAAEEEETPASESAIGDDFLSDVPDDDGVA